MEIKLNKTQRENPRYDLLTGDILPFKSKEFYLTNFYSSKSNLKKHFKSISPKEIEKITTDIIRARVNNKNLKYALSQVELRSLIAPSINILDKFGISYLDICKKLNLITKYKYDYITLPQKLISKVIIDTREQRPFKFDIPVQVDTLKFGDYALSTNLEDTIVIERKSLPDFVSTLSGGFTRFEKEINKAIKYNSNILMIVENDMNTCLEFNYLPHMRFSKATPEFIFNRLRFLIQKYPNFQVAFVKNKEQATKLTLFVLSIGKKIFNYDIQYQLDTKKILND